jgi:signal transduction histidine kinase
MSEEKNRRVLVIDDNRAIHDDFQKILGPRSRDRKEISAVEDSLFGDTNELSDGERFTIDSACQGQEGLECVRQAHHQGRPYALAFIDVRMPPGWDGVQTTSEIWKLDPDIQVVICTAYSDYSWREMLAKLGRSDRLVVLKKPFDNIEVAQLAETLSTKWDLARQARRKLRDLEQLVEQRTVELTRANWTLRAENEQRKIVERDRQMMEVQLRQAHKLEAIGQLAAGIAHEINTPTQYVGDNTHFIEDSWAALAKVLHSHQELLRALKERSVTPEMTATAQSLVDEADLEYLYEQIPAAIKATLEGVERITKIVRAMKDFSHPGSKEKTVADLNKAIESTTTVARNEWKYIAELKLELDPALPMVPCFLGEFNQSILNLVINASHAIGDVVKDQPGGKGTITIQTRQAGDHAEIRVSDSGSGIAESVRPHIFEPFFTTKEVGKGSGQGLSIVYGCIVKKHGGSVTFETEVGKGTTFILRLPLKAAVGNNGFATHEGSTLKEELLKQAVQV